MNEETVILQERAILVGILLEENSNDCYSSIDELEELAKTANAIVVGRVIQKRRTVDRRVVIGSGKLVEIATLARELDANVVIFDIDLSPTQLNNIESVLGVKVIDRTTLILDIFALRAKSAEGKLQVELAQLKCELPKLKGQGVEMSKTGQGIGARGPGETKLETDKRHIKAKIEKIKNELVKVSERRNELKKNRIKNNVKTISLVGYTNAGKSTLLNVLTDSDVYCKDQLFATLDPTARSLSLPSKQDAVLVDTVGFIRNLPHFLINAFKSTLDQVVDSDLVLNVCDYSSAESNKHIEVTTEILQELGYTGKIITVYNKIDKVSDKLVELSNNCLNNTIYISCQTKFGIDDLIKKIDLEVFDAPVDVVLSIPYSRPEIIAELNKSGSIIETEYKENCQIVTAKILVCNLRKYDEFIAN